MPLLHLNLPDLCCVATAEMKHHFLDRLNRRAGLSGKDRQYSRTVELTTTLLEDWLMDVLNKDL